MNPTDKSNEEKLSQLMDGEWHELDPTDCVASLCDDKALHTKWSRYHVIRDVLKNEPIQADSALAMRICDAIKDEPAYTNVTPFSLSPSPGPTDVTPAEPSASTVPLAAGSDVVFVESSDDHAEAQSSWVNTGVAGFAVAASVALVTVVGLNLAQQQEPEAVLAQTITSTAAVGTPLNNRLPVVEFVSNTGPFWVSPESSSRVSDESRLNRMLSRHIENSPTAVRGGLLPYSRLVGYEENNQRP